MKILGLHSQRRAKALLDIQHKIRYRKIFPYSKSSNRNAAVNSGRSTTYWTRRDGYTPDHKT
jgi:hypothetical protein